MAFIFYLLICLLGFSSYTVAVIQMRRGHYRPNTFSRGIWLLLALNSTIGVILGHASTSSIVLSSVMLIGSIAVFVGSLQHGRRSFGVLEKICVILLILSLLVWLLFNTPLINVAISLVAHFIGALPTYKHVWAKPSSENKAFWLLFALASLLSVAVALDTPLIRLMVPIYFACFDSSMFILSMRGSGHVRRLLGRT